MATQTSPAIDFPRYENLTLVPAADALGAEIQGIDLANIDKDTYQSIRNALVDNLVVLIRDQNINDEELVAFSRLFGDLDLAPPQENGQQAVNGLPEIMVISNVKENGVPIGSLGDGEAIWHSDMNYVDVPPIGSALYSLEIPDRGGNTGFCNMYMALAALSADLRGKLTGLSIKHDSSMTSGGFLRAGMDEVVDVRKCPGAIHPIIRTHPESGREVLYLGRRLNAYIMGMPVDKSEALLDEIWQHTTRDEHTWHHQWQVGDVVLWDNRAVMHRRDAFDAGQRRVMHRTQIGDRPAA
jgi:taurine dioxygenase